MLKRERILEIVKEEVEYEKFLSLSVVYSHTNGLGRNSELFEFYNIPKKSLITEGVGANILNWTQTTFSYLSWLPGPGSFFSAANAIIYTFKGEMVKGLFSLIASLSGTVGKYVTGPFKKLWSALPNTSKIVKLMWSKGGQAGQLLAKSIIGLAKTNRNLLKKIVGKVLPKVTKIQKFLTTIIPSLKNFMSKVSGGLLTLPKAVEKVMQKVIDNLSHFFGKLTKVTNDFFLKKYGKGWVKKLLNGTLFAADKTKLVDKRSGLTKTKSQNLNPDAPAETTNVYTGDRKQYEPSKIKRNNSSGGILRSPLGRTL